MKIAKKHKSNKVTVKKKPIEKSKKGKVLIVAQEIKFARLLSGNDKKSRDRVLKSLKKWLVNCFAKGHEFKENDFTRIWKGLFYAVWMSDKPLVQEELCDNIAGILDHFPPEQIKYALMMTAAGYRVLAKEWFGIDLHRLDKFLMLVRRLLRGILRCLHRCEWSEESCQLFTEALFTGEGVLATETPVYARNSTSMILHILECYLEEICKVSKGTIPSSSVTILFTPIASLLTFSKNIEVVRAARRVFAALIRQSDEGLEYQEKQEAWKRMGCPSGGPDALEITNESDDDEALVNGDKESDDSEETESCTEENGVEDGENEENDEGPLDPRAGRVNVILNTIPVPSKELAAVLNKSLTKCGSKAQKRTRIVIERLEALSASRYPFPLVVPDKEELQTGVRTRALALVKHDEKLYKNSDDLGIKGLKRKQKKRLLAKARAGLSIVEDVEELKSKTLLNGKRPAQATELSEPPAKKTKQIQKDTRSNKENVEKQKNKRKKHKLEKSHSEKDKTTQKEKSPQKEKQPLEEKIEEKRNQKVKNKVDKTQKKEKLKEKKQNHNTKLTNGKITNHSVAEEKILKMSKKLDKLINNKQQNKVVNPPENKLSKRMKNYQKTISAALETPKKVKFVLQNNSMQAPVDYYKSVRKSPSIPFDGTKQPSKTNLKPSTPSPINPFFKKKMKLKSRL